MSEQITLTAEQKARKSALVAELKELSLQTTETDWEGSEAVVLRLMDNLGIERSPEFKFFRAVSPIEAGLVNRQLSRPFDMKGVELYGINGLCAHDIVAETVALQLSPKTTEYFKILKDFTRLCGGVYLHSHFANIYDRPSVLKLVMQGVRSILHCEDGPAIAWGRGPDGSYSPDAERGRSFYYWQGTRVPEHWILNKPNPDDREAMKARAQEVLSQTNQETLRAGCEILGWTPILEALGMKILDEDPNPSFGKLVSVDLPNAPDSRFIVAECGTGRTIAVPVSAEAKTAVEAGAMSYGIPEHVYRTVRVRT
jgi:hypothetical protein